MPDRHDTGQCRPPAGDQDDSKKSVAKRLGKKKVTKF